MFHSFALCLYDKTSVVAVWEFNALRQRWQFVTLIRFTQAVAISKGTGRLIFPTSVSYGTVSKFCSPIAPFSSSESLVNNYDRITAFLQKNPGQTYDSIADYLKMELPVVLRCLRFLQARKKIHSCRLAKRGKNLYYCGAVPDRIAIPKA